MDGRTGGRADDGRTDERIEKKMKKERRSEKKERKKERNALDTSQALFYCHGWLLSKSLIVYISCPCTLSVLIEEDTG